MKTKKSKIRNLLLSLLIVAVIATAGIFAYLTTIKEAINTFNVGEVKIAIEEPNWKPDTDTDGDNQNDAISKIMPNVSIPKDPLVINKGDNDAYVYMMVEVPKIYSGNIAVQNEDGSWTTEEVNHYPLFDYEVNPEWILVASKTNDDMDAYDYFVYAYDKALVANKNSENNKSTPLFGEITFANVTSDFVNVLTGENIIDLKVNITGYAIQSDFYAGEADSAEEAWQLYANQNEFEWPVKGYRGLSTLTYNNEIGQALYSEIVYNGTPIELYVDESLFKTGYSFEWTDSETGEIATNGMPANGDMMFNPSYTLPNNNYYNVPSDIVTYTVVNAKSGPYLAVTGIDKNSSKYPQNLSTLVIPKEITFEIPYNSLQGVTPGSSKDQVAIKDDQGIISYKYSSGLGNSGTLTLPVKEIAQGAFKSHIILGEVWLADTITRINSDAFENCVNLRKIQLPFELLRLDSEVFEGCSGLTSIKIPGKTKIIRNGIFKNCTKLQDVTLPLTLSIEGNDIIPEYAFYGCSNLKSINIPTPIYYSNDINSIYYSCGISEYAFANCTQLKEINLPQLKSEEGYISSVTFDNNSFENCSALTDINMPHNCEGLYIENEAFINCKSLKRIEFEAPIYNLGDAAFKGCSKLVEVNLKGDPDDFYEIPAQCFQNCTSLETITLPRSMCYIYSEAFSGCSSLEQVIGGNSVSDIYTKAFANCKSLQTVSFLFNPNLLYIYDYAFQNCTSLQTVALSERVDIGTNAFVGCTGIKTLNIPVNLNITKSAFPSSQNINHLILRKGTGSMKDYTESSIQNVAWYNSKDSIARVTIEDGITNIGNYAFSNMSSLYYIELPESIENIGDYAFANSGLVDFAIPSKVTTIPYYGFKNCTKLETISLSDGVQMINGYAFEGCEKLTKVDFPENLQYIGYRAFAQTGFTDLVVPEVKNYIDNNAFEGCSFREVIIPETMQPSKLRDEAFKNSTIKNLKVPECFNLKYENIQLENVLVTNGVSQMSNFTVGQNDNWIINCDNLIFKQGVEYIGAAALTFSKIQNLTLPNSIKTVGENAFSYKYLDSSNNTRSAEAEINTVNYLGNINEWCKIDFKNDHSSPMYNTGSEEILLNNEPITGDVVLNDDATCVPAGTFQNSQISSIAFNNVKTIGAMAFAFCDNITNITVPDSVSYIGDYAFGECVNLNYASIPAATYGVRVFSNCANLKDIAITQGCGNIKDYSNTTSWGNSLSDPNYTENTPWNSVNNLETITIGPGVESIGAYAFYGVSANNVKILEGLKSIGTRAFPSSGGLTAIYLPKSLITIEDEAFSFCYNILQVFYNGTLDEWQLVNVGSSNECLTRALILEANTDNAYYIPGAPVDGLEYTLYGNGELVITCNGDMPNWSKGPWDFPQIVKSVTFTDGITSIGNYAFDGCENLMQITIPASITNIGDKAFNNCSSLMYIDVDEDNPNYSNDEFGVLFNKNKTELIQYTVGSSRLNYTVPNGVISIAENAFKEGSLSKFRHISSVTLPNTLETIGQNTFQYCNNLKQSFYNGTPEEWQSVIVGSGNNYLTNTLIYEADSEKPYYVIGVCGEGITYTLYADGELVIIGEGQITSKPWSKHADVITSVTISNGITNIVDSAFYRCVNLTDISIPNSITSIEAYAFYDCSKLENVVLPNNLQSVGNYAFAFCSKLTNVNIPNSVANIGEYAFYECDSFINITLPTGITSVSNNIFAYCDNLENVIIPQGVTSIGNYAFRSCKKLINATIPQGVTTIGKYAFYECESLTDIVIPKGVTTIDSSAFCDCLSVENLSIPKTVINIGSGAFHSYDQISFPTNIYYEGSQTDWNNIVIDHSNTWFNPNVSTSTIHYNSYNY